MGGFDIANFETREKIWEENETDPDNGITFCTSCISVSMADLIPNKEMLSIFRSAAKPVDLASRTDR